VQIQSALLSFSAWVFHPDGKVPALKSSLQKGLRAPEANSCEKIGRKSQTNKTVRMECFIDDFFN
jgi:hypothetical protein